MPHFKCVPCRTRVYSGAGPAELFDELCPDCGSPFEPIGELAELVGFRSVTTASDLRQQLAQAVAMPRPDTTL
jgi:hypothetical protein